MSVQRSSRWLIGLGRRCGNDRFERAFAISLKQSSKSSWFEVSLVSTADWVGRKEWKWWAAGGFFGHAWSHHYCQILSREKQDGYPSFNVYFWHGIGAYCIYQWWSTPQGIGWLRYLNTLNSVRTCSQGPAQVCHFRSFLPFQSAIEISICLMLLYATAWVERKEQRWQAQAGFCKLSRVQSAQNLMFIAALCSCLGRKEVAKSSCPSFLCWIFVKNDGPGVLRTQASPRIQQRKAGKLAQFQRLLIYDMAYVHGG